MMVNESPKHFLFSGYKLDLLCRKLYSPGGEAVNLSSRAFEVLVLLVTRSGQTISKNAIMEAVWPNNVVEENNLNQAISSLRKVLNDPKSQSRIIQTVTGRGYCFVDALEVCAESAEAPATASLTTDHDQPPMLPANPGSSGAIAKLFNRKQLFAACVAVLAIGGILVGVTRFAGVAATGTGAHTLAQQQAPAILNVIPNSIAILPFSNLNPDQEEKAFSLGLHDELINQLTKVKSLKVLSGDSVQALAEQGKSMADIGQILRVESIMTGSILLVGGKSRVNLRLLDPRTSLSLWAASYDADSQNLLDMIAIQSDIASNVARALEAEIKTDEKAAIAQYPTKSFEAYRFLLAAKYAHKNQDFPTAWTLGKKAIDLDPNYVDALIHFGHVNSVMTAVSLIGLSSAQHYQLALESIDKAIALSPDNVDAYLQKAAIYSMNRQWSQAMAIAEQLKKKGVPLAQMKAFGAIMLNLGDFKGAVELYEANLDLEPVNFSTRGFLLMAYELNGQRQRARQEFLLGEELSPEWWGDTVNIFLAMGRREPIAEVGGAINIPDELKTLLQHLDDKAFVLNAIGNFQHKDNKIGAELVYYSAISALIGEDKLALDFMRESLQTSWQGFFWLWLPVFDELRTHEEFRDLLKESGIVEYWQQHGWPKACQPKGATFTCDWQAYPSAKVVGHGK